MKRAIWNPQILLVGGRTRKLLSCKQVLHFMKKKDDFEDGIKSHGDFFPGLQT